MFKSTVFDDINKAAYDVLKDGYCLDSKMALKTILKDNKVTLEGRSCSGSMIGKLTLDMKERKYIQRKKMSIDSNGVFASETDMTNILNNTTFMIRSAFDFANWKKQKRTVGMKYVTDSCAADLMVDMVSKGYSTSFTYLKGSFLMGCQLRGDLEHYVSSVDPCICYHHNDAMLSVGFKDYFTILRAALYAEPFVNVKVSATAELPIEGKEPELAFGFAMKPSRESEARMKVDQKGFLSLCYKSLVGDNMTIAVNATTPLDLSIKSETKVGFSMEMTLYLVFYITNNSILYAVCNYKEHILLYHLK